MEYWYAVLDEVLNKLDDDYFFRYTSQGRLHEVEECCSADEAIALVKEKRDLRMYYLGDAYPGVYFTKREAQTFFWVVQGYTIAKAAAMMSLSMRTVEFYVKNMKVKLNCASKKRMIQLVLQTNLLSELAKDGMQVTLH